MRRREVKIGMEVKVYREIQRGWKDLTGKKGKVEYVSLLSIVTDLFPIKVKIEGIITPQWLSHKELKEIK